MIRVLLLSLFLTACGGGSVPVVSFYGDSITSGGTEKGWLNPRPVQRINEYAAGAFVAVDHSKGGATVQDVAPTWQAAMQSDSSDLVVIRYAGASALGQPDGDYVGLLTAMVQQAGGRAVLVGTPWTCDPLPGISPQDSARIIQTLTNFDAMTRRVASDIGVPFIDVRGVPFGGCADMADAVHPGQAYSDRIGRHITVKMLGILG